MKKFILFTLLSIFMLSCADDSWKQELEEIKAELANQKALIEALQQNTIITSIEQGEGKYTIHFSDGQSITLSNGKTPIITIGENGNWFINGVDTDKPSQGNNGTNGQTPTIEIGENGNWIINGIDTGIKAEIKDNGITDITFIININNELVIYFNDGTTVNIPIINNQTKIEKITIIGDSFCSLGCDKNRGFIWFALNDLGLLDKLDNKAIGGTRLSWSSFDGSDINDYNSMVNRINDISESDIIIIMGGFNDSSSPYSTFKSKVGNIEDSSNKTTIIGSYKYIIEKYKEKYTYSNCRILLMTYPYENNKYHPLINDAIREVANYYKLPLIDLDNLCGFKDGLNCMLERENLIDNSTWVNNQRINFIDGFSIWDGETNTNARNWAYTKEYIKVRTELYTYLDQHDNMSSNILCYKFSNNKYEYLGYVQGRDFPLINGTTHIRVNLENYLEKQSTYQLRPMDGEYVSDGVHPNLLGFKIMYPFLKDMLEKLIY